MATGKPFGYGLLGGLTYEGTNTATSALQQAFGVANAYGNAYVSYDTANQFTITTNPYAQVAVQAQPHRCKGCGASEGKTHLYDCEVVKDQCACHVGRASKHHSIVELLRMEIGSWHGDILERQAA